MSMGEEPLVRKTVTILFCDVVGSTALGENVDPETARRVMLRYFDEARTVLERHGGTVEKFIGDAVVAVFGVPALHEDDALRAVRAADELRRALDELNRELGERWGVRLEWRMAVNTGEVVVGDPASTQTIGSGDTFNVAARLQQAARPGQILLGRETHRLVSDRVEAGPLESFSLKGKAEAVTRWQLEEVHERAADMLRRADSPFVNRERERDELERVYFETVENSSCRLVVVLGPAGLGKTRLAQEFVSRLLAAQVLHGRCLPYGDGITFWPITEVVRDVASISPDDSPDVARAKVTSLLPPSEESELIGERVCTTIGLAEHDPRPEEAFWALRRLFEELARQRPLVLVLEDIHWAEPTLLDLLEYLVGWSSGSPMLLLCLARPELTETRPSFATNAVGLEPLEADEIAALAANALGGAPLDDGVASRVVGAADGNPLFAEELVRAFVDDGALARVEGAWSATGDLGDLRVPPSINALLSARLDRLAPEEREVIRRAAVVGKEFWSGAITNLVPHELRADVAQLLHALVRKRLIVPAGSAPIAGEDAFRFNHILVRDAAYNALPKSLRAELHERHAELLLAKAGARATEIEEIVGFHLEQAFNAHTDLGGIDEHAHRLGELASTYLASAGRRALDRGDMHAAAALLHRATELVDDDRLFAELASDLGFALMELGRLAEAESLLSRAIDVATRLGKPDLQAHAAVVRGYVRFRTDPTGGLEETRAVAEDAIETFTPLDDPHGLAHAWRLLSLTHSWHCQWSAMEGALRQALEHAQRAGDRRELTTIVSWLGIALYYGPTPAPDGIRQYEEVLAEHVGDRVVEASTACRLAGLLAMRGRFDEAREHAGRCTTILDELGLRVRSGHARVFVAAAELLAGDARAAEQDLLAAYATMEQAGDRAGALATAFEIARVLYIQGRYADAEQWAAQDPETVERSDVMTRVVGLAVAAQLAARAGRVADAERLGRRAVELGEQTDALNIHADALLALSEIFRLDGRAPEARTACEDAVRLYETKGNSTAAAQARTTAGAFASRV
jgi:class 3 adenylate cyclase/tetratricopeptide (TPR) repeat protein